MNLNLEAKPFIEDLKVEHYLPENRQKIRDRLNNLLKSGQCKKVYIVTGEMNLFKADSFIEACKTGVELYPPLQIKVIGHIFPQSQEFKDFKNKIASIQKNFEVYKTEKYPLIHFWLIKTKDNKTHLFFQRKHHPGEPKDEWFVENPFFLKWKYKLKFMFLQKKLVS